LYICGKNCKVMKSIKLAFIALAVLPLLSLFGCEIQTPDQNEPKTENKDNPVFGLIIRTALNVTIL